MERNKIIRFELDELKSFSSEEIKGLAGIFNSSYIDKETEATTLQKLASPDSVDLFFELVTESPFAEYSAYQ